MDNSEKQRDNWAGKEKDKENGLGDHGVRKYDHLIGRFTSIDPLWSNYLGWNPYQYSANSPVHLVDLNGKYFTWGIYKGSAAEFDFSNNQQMIMTEVLLDFHLADKATYELLANSDVEIRFYYNPEGIYKGRNSGGETGHRNPDGTLKSVYIYLNFDYWEDGKDEARAVLFEELYHAADQVSEADDPQYLNKWYERIMEESRNGVKYENKFHERSAKNQTKEALERLSPDQEGASESSNSGQEGASESSNSDQEGDG